MHYLIALTSVFFFISPIGLIFWITFPIFLIYILYIGKPLKIQVDTSIAFPLYVSFCGIFALLLGMQYSLLISAKYFVLFLAILSIGYKKCVLEKLSSALINIVFYYSLLSLLLFICSNLGYENIQTQLVKYLDTTIGLAPEWTMPQAKIGNEFFYRAIGLYHDPFYLALLVSGCYILSNNKIKKIIFIILLLATYSRSSIIGFLISMACYKIQPKFYSLTLLYLAILLFYILAFYTLDHEELGIGDVRRLAYYALPFDSLLLNPSFTDFIDFSPNSGNKFYNNFISFNIFDHGMSNSDLNWVIESDLMNTFISFGLIATILYFLMFRSIYYKCSYPGAILVIYLLFSGMAYNYLTVPVSLLYFSLISTIHRNSINQKF